MLPNKIAFVDIETTGAYMMRDRIIEIAIIVTQDYKIIKTYQSLVNPQTYVSPFITAMTGIREEELFESPSFEKIKDEILSILEDSVFVAHNARFDLGFLKNEFARFGTTFSPKHFCTVRLSRMLFPKYKRHNLDSIIERFGFYCENRHRAYDDAHVLYQFYTKIKDLFPLKVIEEKITTALKKPTLPSLISQKTVDSIPKSSGVYIFYDSTHTPLYVGKSTNIRSRVLSHFSSDYRSQKEMQMAQQVSNIETIDTPGELGALLKEAMLVKTLQPNYNRLLRQKKMVTILRKNTTTEGYSTVIIEQTEQLKTNMLSEIVGVFSSKKQAKDFLFELAKKHRLCHKLLSLEASSSYCFAYRLDNCKGACMQKESPKSYNMRAIIAFSAKAFTQWPFPGAIAITESTEDNLDTFIVNKWCVLSNKDEDAQLFDVDTYKILKKYIANKKNWRNIHQLNMENTGITGEYETHFQYG